MIIAGIEVPFASFRKSFARSYGETYAFVPPSTMYGMLLSLVGEQSRNRHEGVKLAFAYRSIPRISAGVQKRSRHKYGTIGAPKDLGNSLDFNERLCGISLLCWIDSTDEVITGETLEYRVKSEIRCPRYASRFGVLSLGLSDDLVNEINLVDIPDSTAYRLILSDSGHYELPIWVDHLGSKGTRWQRYNVDQQPCEVTTGPTSDWPWTKISRI